MLELKPRQPCKFAEYVENKCKFNGVCDKPFNIYCFKRSKCMNRKEQLVFKCDCRKEPHKIHNGKFRVSNEM